MTEAWRILVPLCAFGFLKEFRPSEPFVSQYLMDDSGKNFTRAQLSQELYPVGTYSNLSLLVLVFLLTDWARYKPVIVLEGLSGVVTYALIIWGRDIPTIQVAEFFYGLFMASEVAYLTYIYAMNKIDDFQKVSGYVRSGILLGRFAAGVVSQLTVSLQILSYHQLNYLTLGGVSLSILAALILPPVNQTLYFHQEAVSSANNNVAYTDSTVSLPNPDIRSDDQSPNDFEDINLEGLASHSQMKFENQVLSNKFSNRTGLASVLHAIGCDFSTAYRNTNVLRWSLWWALATCGYLQVTSYIQILWEVAAANNQLFYNGLIDALYTLIGSISTWLVGIHKINLSRYSTVILVVCCLLQGLFLLISVWSMNLWVQYTFYILFKVLHHSTMVLASSEIAVPLKADSHALIFGFNMFIALALQSVFTLIVAGKGGFKLEIRSQFFVYGGYFVAVGAGYIIWSGTSALFTVLHNNLTKTKVPTVEIL